MHCILSLSLAMVSDAETIKNKKIQQVQQFEDWTKELLATSNDDFFECDIAQSSELKFFFNVAWDSALVMCSKDGTLIKFVFATDTD